MRRRMNSLVISVAAGGAVLAPVALVPVAHAESTPSAALAIAPDTLDYRVTAERDLAPGVRHTSYRVTSAKGGSDAQVLTVDLRTATTDLLAAPVVAQRVKLDAMADDAGALAAINGDYFNMFEDATHPGIVPTDASVGVEITDGKLRKYAGPYAQRFGEYPPKALNDGDEVLGVLRNRRGVLTDVALDAYLMSAETGQVKIDGVNQYAMARGQITAFDETWGPRSRARVGCGSEIRRADPCSTSVREVVITGGRVTAVSDTIGGGQLTKHQVALVGREAGAQVLAKLEVGDQIDTHWKAKSAEGKLDWGIGGGVMVRDGVTGAIPVRPLNPRTMAGISQEGRTMYLVVIDGRSTASVGVTAREITWFTTQLGAWDALMLDGGASSAMVGRTTQEEQVGLLSSPYIGSIRPGPNGIAVFAGRHH